MSKVAGTTADVKLDPNSNVKVESDTKFTCCCQKNLCQNGGILEQFIANIKATGKAKIKIGIKIGDN